MTLEQKQTLKERGHQINKHTAMTITTKLRLRPTITDEMKLAAAEVIANSMGLNDDDAKIIADEYQYGDDGYDLAKKLEAAGFYIIRMADIEILDTMNDEVRARLRAAVRKWFEETRPQPPFPIGTQITIGKITGIYEHEPAKYLVKVPGTPGDSTRRRIVNFEDAKAVVE